MVKMINSKDYQLENITYDACEHLSIQQKFKFIINIEVNGCFRVGVTTKTNTLNYGVFID